MQLLYLLILVKSSEPIYFSIIFLNDTFLNDIFCKWYFFKWYIFPLKGENVSLFQNANILCFLFVFHFILLCTMLLFNIRSLLIDLCFIRYTYRGLINLVV